MVAAARRQHGRSSPPSRPALGATQWGLLSHRRRRGGGASLVHRAARTHPSGAKCDTAPGVSVAAGTPHTTWMQTEPFPDSVTNAGGVERPTHSKLPPVCS